MLNYFTPDKHDRASLSRRDLFLLVTGASAAGTPLLAYARASETEDVSLPLMTEAPIDEQFSACVIQLKDVLARMHPDASIDCWQMWPIDGGFEDLTFRIAKRKGGKV